MGIVGWKGKSTIRAYVPRNERLHYLRLIGADTTPYEKNKFQEQRVEEQKEGEEQRDADDRKDGSELKEETEEKDNVNEPKESTPEKMDH